MKVLVLGASGKVGRLVVPLLVADGHEVVAAVRRDDAAAAAREAGAAPVTVDLEAPAGEDGLTAALEGADAVVFTAGADVTTGHEHSDRVDRDGALRAIAAADAAGVGRWVQVSSLYADRIDSAPPVLAHFLGNKAAADAALADTSMTWTVVRPGGLKDDPGTGAVTIVAEGMGHGFVTRADVAAVIASVLRTGAAANRAFDLAAGEQGVDEALAALD